MKTTRPIIRMKRPKRPAEYKNPKTRAAAIKKTTRRRPAVIRTDCPYDIKRQYFGEPKAAEFVNTNHQLPWVNSKDYREPYPCLLRIRNPGKFYGKEGEWLQMTTGKEQFLEAEQIRNWEFDHKLCTEPPPEYLHWNKEVYKRLGIRVKIPSFREEEIREMYGKNLRKVRHINETLCGKEKELSEEITPQGSLEHLLCVFCHRYPRDPVRCLAAKNSSPPHVTCYRCLLRTLNTLEKNKCCVVNSLQCPVDGCNSKFGRSGKGSQPLSKATLQMLRDSRVECEHCGLTDSAFRMGAHLFDAHPRPEDENSETEDEDESESQEDTEEDNDDVSSLASDGDSESRELIIDEEKDEVANEVAENGTAKVNALENEVSKESSGPECGTSTDSGSRTVSTDPAEGPEEENLMIKENETGLLSLIDSTRAEVNEILGDLSEEISTETNSMKTVLEVVRMKLKQIETLQIDATTRDKNVIQELKAQILELEKRIITINGTLSTKTEELRKAEKSHDLQRKELQDIQAVEIELRTSLEKEKKTYEDLETRVRDCKEKSDELESENTAIRDEKERIETEIAGLRKEMKALESENDMLKKEMIGLRESIRVTAPIGSKEGKLDPVPTPLQLVSSAGKVHERRRRRSKWSPSDSESEPDGKRARDTKRRSRSKSRGRNARRNTGDGTRASTSGYKKPVGSKLSSLALQEGIGKEVKRGEPEKKGTDGQELSPKKGAMKETKAYEPPSTPEI